MQHDVCQTLRSEPEPVVFLVRANPEPGDCVSFPHPDSTKVIADSHNANAIAPLLEFQRRVIRIAPPKGIFFTGTVSGRRQAGLQSTSRIAAASCRSRQFLNPPRSQIRPDLLQNAAQTPALREIRVNLPIPRQFLAPANERRQLCEFRLG
jgi:hypothetical protein